jgi:hypothetical protein
MIYALKSTSTTHLNTLNPLNQTRFFSSKEKAIAALEKIRKDIETKPGVKHLEYSEDKLSYCFGWEEHMIMYRIMEIDVE